MWNSLRTRLTFIFVGLAVGPVLLVGVILSQRSFTVEQEQAVDLQRQVVQRVSSEVDAFLAALENDITLLGGEIRSLAQPDRAQQLSLLLGALNTGTYRDVYEELRLLDARGQEQVRLTRLEIVASNELTSRAGEEEFEQPLATRTTYLSPVWFNQTTGEPFVTIAIPLTTLRSVEISSVLVADFRFEAIRNLIAGLQTVEGQTIYIIDSEGRVVAHQDPSVVLRGTTIALPSDVGRAEGVAGSDVLFATDNVQSGNLSLTAVAERPVSEALELAQNGLVVSTVVTALALVAAVVLVIITVRQVVRPIEKLSAVAQSIQEGDLSARATVRSRDEIGTLAQSFNAMTSRLRDMIQSLEDRVNERVRDLTVASDVSRQITTELDSSMLLSNVAELTATAFKFYHVSIFLYSDEDQLLRLRQGMGDAGRQMVEMGKVFRLEDQGLVPQAARSRSAQVSNDVQADPNHLKNPLLPNTRSELAVPMLYRGQLIGVLDLQAKDVNRFREEDVRILTTLAEQIAIAVQNAQLFETVQSALIQAELANSVKSAFLASMSHELRTPLNSVINFTKFVAKGTVGPVNEEQVQMLNEVIDSAKHLLTLINDVLDMSKIESGTLNLFVEENIDLNPIINSVLATGRSLIADKPIKLGSNIAPALPLIRGDRQRILQILLNIMSNACKFTDEGTITIAARQQGDMIEVSVQDTGPGIAPDDQADVFEPFKQTDTGLRQAGGTGLGMPISKNLVEAHGGRMWLESVLGRGATFYVLLPVRSETLTPINIGVGVAK
jgi:signal transduction histidine kinase